MLGMGKNTVEIIIAAKDRTQAAFAKVNTQMKTMGGTSGRLNSAMGSLKGGLSKVTSSLGSVGAALGPVGIAVAGVAVVMATLGGAAFKASLEFEKAFATIRVGTGATGKVLAGLEGSFKTVFTSVPATTAAAATAIADLNTRLGITGEPLEALSTQFLNLSRITGTDVSSAISSATRVMHDFAVRSEEQSGALDYLFKVSQSTGIGMTQLSSSMTQYGSVMRQMGFDINESAALLGKFEKEGVNLQLVLGSLRQGLAKFSKAGEEPVEALARVSAKIQSMGSVADANALAIETFGARAGPDMAAAIREGRFSIEELMATLDASGETINKAAADTLTFGDKWTLLKNNITEAIAPIGDVITNVLGNAIEGLSGVFDGLQKVIGPAFNIITIKFQVLKAFLEGLFTPIIAALAPLKETLDALQQKFAETSGRLSLLSDIFTIIAGAAKWLGKAIGSLVAMALTPLVAKLQEGIDMLAAFYDKLGPIKSALEWVGEGVSNVADSFRETVPPIEEVGKALEALAKEGPNAPKAVADAWALAIKDFQEGSGTYKEAIGGIEEKITALTEEWMTATDKRKAAIENEVELLHNEETALEDLKATAEDALSNTIEKTKEAVQKQEEFEVTIGDTTITFKEQAATVVKNADAYKKLQDSAQKLIDLDWSVFTELEATLPTIETGIQDMASAFSGLEEVLETNIGELGTVKQSVMDISEIAAPFLEAGFLEGIKSIGDFAGSLKGAGSAINTFSSLQDVSIEGCINFSMHVHDMVSALEILENQMEDLVPAFGDMDLLIGNIIETFVWTPGKRESLADEINRVAHAAKDGKVSFYELHELLRDTATGVGYGGIDFTAPFLKRYKEGVEDVEVITTDLLATEKVLERQMGYTTSALAFQTGQLKKITDALEPYVAFMRTLNELAALSTLSTEDLNNGLNAINDTLLNLGKSLETFDLRPVMAALFGTEIPGKAGVYTGGIAKGFTDVMTEYQGVFSTLIEYISRLSFAISSLVSSFDALANISESVLADQKKLKEVFEGITTVMSNFSTEMGGAEGFAQKFADGMDAMLKSAAPLIAYFQKNNAAVELFNSTLTMFTTIIKNVVDAMDMLKRMSEMILPSVTELEAGFGKVEEALSRFTEAISTSFADVKIELVALDKEWSKHKEGVKKALESFSAATNTITTLSSEIITLSASLKELKDMSVLSMRDIDEAMKKIPLFLDDFVDALRLNMYVIKESLKDLDKEWSKHAEEMRDVMPAYEDSTSQIGKLVGSLLSLNSALNQLAEMGTISSIEFDRGFISLMSSISNFAVSLGKNVDGLIGSLRTLRIVWMENESVLVPLMRDFSIISDNLWGVAHNTNRMAEEFKKLSGNSVTLEKGFKSLIDFINQIVKSTKEFYTAEAAAELAAFITDVDKVIDAFVDLEIELKKAMRKVEDAIDGAVNNMHKEISTLGDLPDSAYFHGLNTLNEFVNGLIDKEPALIAEMQVISGIIHDFLGVESNTERGPLSRLESWGPQLVKTYAAGIEQAMGTLNASFADFAPSIGAGVDGNSTNNNVNLYISQNITDRATAEYANHDLQRLISRNTVM